MQKVLIIGASRGIGAACVRRFARAGAQVAFTYAASEEKALALSAETGATAIRCDAADAAAMQALPGQLPFVPDTLIYAAGIAKTSLIQDVSVAEWEHLFAVNVTGAFLMARAFLPALISMKKGSITFITSMWGEVGASCEAAYSATKGALIAFAKALAKEEGPSGIRVNCVSPGVIDTDMMACYSAEDKASLAEETPLGRLGMPDEVADTVYYLSSEEARFVSGAVVRVNGGFIT